MSGAERLKVSTAIVRKLNPQCGFVLLDKLEQMDRKTLQEFGEWLEAEGLQAIATRVSTGDECSIIIEDGYVVGQEHPEEPQQKSMEGRCILNGNYQRCDSLCKEGGHLRTRRNWQIHFCQQVPRSGVY